MRAFIFLLLAGFVIAPPLSSHAADLDNPAGNGYSLDEDLVYRINFGSAEDIKVLLDKGANPNAITKTGDPVMFMALTRNDRESVGMVKYLLDKGANANTTDKTGTYAVVIAAKNGQSEMVDAFIAHGADPHIKDTDGTPLTQIARKYCSAQTANAIQAIIDRQIAYAASFRTQVRFNQIIRQYSYESCEYQYWSYFLSSRAAPERDGDTQQRIDGSRATLAALLKEIQKYYPTTRTEDLQAVSDMAAHTVYDQIDSLISNRDRAEHGYGAEADAKKRCDEIADHANIAFVPADLIK